MSTKILLVQFRGRKGGELKTNTPGAVGSFSDTNKRAHWTETWRVTFKGWSQQWCHSSSWSDQQNTNGQTLILSSVLTPTDTESSRSGTDSPGCLVSMSAPRWTSQLQLTTPSRRTEGSTRSPTGSCQRRVVTRRVSFSWAEPLSGSQSARAVSIDRRCQ